ncbi:hypothetical protein [Sphingosinicella rhizophila]|uniref:Uncharacterized protein n=1 Tax=Sphingosinicella rhizophila TaxID=3050082 RepID=A0ABU3Q2U1_9SPHN|nr:hypothetical protein [Sphingosinicella sp. GR2756]MDT9597627.1 hypothetical protein [Sphingosinicella sp. GR2756]
MDVDDGSHCYGLVMSYDGVAPAAYRRGAGDATFVARAGTEGRLRQFWSYDRNRLNPGDCHMAARNSELPEGTDHIINGAMETSAGGGGGSAGATGFVGSNSADDTGGTRVKDENGTEDGGVLDQLRSQASSLRGQAGGRVREFAESGKNRATEALDEVSRVVSDAAESIDERLGSEYGEYARRAADAVSGFADTLRNKDVEEIYDDASAVVRKSPGVALAAAAIVGFALVRLVKAGLPEDRDGGPEDMKA